VDLALSPPPSPEPRQDPRARHTQAVADQVQRLLVVGHLCVEPGHVEHVDNVLVVHLAVVLVALGRQEPVHPELGVVAVGAAAAIGLCVVLCVCVLVNRQAVGAAGRLRWSSRSSSPSIFLVGNKVMPPGPDGHVRGPS